MERYVGKHQKEPGHQTRDTASPVDYVRSPEDRLTGKPVTESNPTLMHPRTSPLFGMTGPAWRRGPRSVKIRMIGAITRSLMPM